MQNITYLVHIVLDPFLRPALVGFYSNAPNVVYPRVDLLKVVNVSTGGLP